MWQHLDEHTLRLISKAVNPLLTILLIGAIIWRSRNDVDFRVGRFVVSALLAIVLAFILGRINAELKLWPGLPSDRKPYEFPSGHTCYAVAVATSLYLINRRWLFFAVPLLAAYGMLIVLPPLHFHSWLDVIGAWVLTPPLALLCHKFKTRARQNSAV